MKLSVCVFLVSAAVLVTAQNDDQDYAAYDNYDDYFDDTQLLDEENKLEAELDKLKDVSDLKVKDDIEKFIKEQPDYVIKDDDIDEYQYEDNRDKPKDLNKDVPADNDGSFGADDNEKDAADYAVIWGDDSVAPLPVPDSESILEDKVLNDKDVEFDEEKGRNLMEEIENKLDKILLDTDKTVISDKKTVDETGQVIKETADSSLEEVVFPDSDKNIKEEQNNGKMADDVIEETKKILEETDDSFNSDAIVDEINHAAPITNEIQEETKRILEEGGDSFDDANVVEDTLDARIGDLMSIFKDDGLLEIENINNKDNIVNEKDLAYEDLNADLDKLFEALDKLSDSSDSDVKAEEILNKIDENFNENFEDSDKNIVKDNADGEEVDLNKVELDILNENDLPNTRGSKLQNDEINKPNPSDVFETDAETIKTNNETILLDAIIEDESNEAESIESVNNKNIDASIEKTVDISSLNSEEMEDLVQQFAQVNSEVLDVNAESFNQNIAPIRITLNVDTPIVVTSPNYPSAYPTNNVVDWVFDGEGSGIEMNITDFAVNGALGDYLMVKPGGVDDSGHDSLLFTYRLNSEKKFRFTDVDRVFVRFESKPGFMFMRGFRFTIKMIGPLPEEPLPVPEPEPVVAAPSSTHAVHLAAAVPQFQDLREQFRLLIADMAELYVVENDIEPGQNKTSEVTQITAVSTCPVSWPHYELCTRVTFGVPLTDDEDHMLGSEELADMWDSLKTRDPFALRLRQMGIAEFEPPSSSIITAWLAIASGVVLSMAVISFLLWRFSCFEDYTRMQTYSDTDSLHNGKRDLDLYPTPHQTLPPLYSDHQYKWADNEDSTRVDMGGFANKSYARDMYDFESDEEVPPTTRTGAISARDVYTGSNA